MKDDSNHPDYESACGRYPHLFPALTSAIRIEGEIDDSVQQRVWQALDTWGALSPPMVILINSPGGDVGCLLRILEKLQQTRQRFSKPVLSTYGVGICKSAGAELLISGDYVIAQHATEVFLHKGNAYPDAGADPDATKKHIEGPLNARAIAAAEMITLRLIKRGAVCRDNKAHFISIFGKAGWQNLVSGKPLVTLFECIKGRSIPKLSVVSRCLKICREALSISEVESVLAARTRREQEIVFETRVPEAFKALNALVLQMCRHFVRGAYKFTAEEAYWLGLVDEVEGTELPNMRAWVQQHW